VDVERGDCRLAVLAVIVVAYLCAATAFALATPLWQTPDEPAHYNYIRYLIEQRALPVLRQGDYDFAYLEHIKAARFPPDMPVDSIRYEFHQPPLYYLVGAIVASPFPPAGRPTVLRLFSVLLGACLLWVTYRTVRAIASEQPAWALGATAFVATVPMHVALTAAVSNDALAELIVGLVLLALIRRVMSGSVTWLAADVRLGLLLGLGLWTKTTAYVLLPLAVFALLAPPLWRCLRGQPAGGESSVNQAMASTARVVGVALVIALPWFIRNAIAYGGLDLLGLARHDSIMGAQPHTADWLARLGWGGLAREFLVTTFHSFWAQFGWMGVPVDNRIYLALGVLSALVALGFVLFCTHECRRLTVRQRWALGVLCMSAALTAASYLWYNVQYVQHQGRYLFPALIPLGTFFALGLWALLDRAWAWWVAALLGLATLAVSTQGWAGGHVNRVDLSMGAGLTAAFAVRAFLAQTWRLALFVVPFVGLWALDFICLFVFVVPALRW
jgi:hypothetical protein